MEAFNCELEAQFDETSRWIKNKYGICIKAKEQLVNFTKTSLMLVLSLKVWEEHLDANFQRIPGIKLYFQEMRSNTIHIIILGNIDMKIPALIMLRRTQEIIMTFLYYSEHPIEFYRKEADERDRTVNGFGELKEYLKRYPYSIKYNVSDENMQAFVSKIIDEWGRQYHNLSNYVHGTNSNFFQGTGYLDEFKFKKTDINDLCREVEKTSSIINTLLILFYFRDYIKFDEHTEKSLIRNAISNKFDYKRNIVELLQEI